MIEYHRIVIAVTIFMVGYVLLAMRRFSLNTDVQKEFQRCRLFGRKWLFFYFLVYLAFWWLEVYAFSIGRFFHRLCQEE